MRINIPILLLTLVFIIPACKTKDTMNPPVADKRPEELIIHGDTRIDNYYWLRERENPEVIAYLNEENAHRVAVMKESEELQENLYKEIVGRIKQDDQSGPYLLQFRPIYHSQISNHHILNDKSNETCLDDLHNAIHY